MQEPRLSVGASFRRTDNGVEVGGTSFDRALALLDGDQLETDRVTWPALGENRQIGFAHYRDLGVAADSRRVCHQTNGRAIGRDLNRSGTASFRRERTE